MKFVIEDANEIGDDEILGDLMEIETIIFINQSRANKDALIAVTTKKYKDKTEKEILEKIKIYERENELGRPYLRHNGPEASKIKQKKEITKKPSPNLEPEVEFDDDDKEYIRMMQEAAEKRRKEKKVAQDKSQDKKKRKNT